MIKNLVSLFAIGMFSLGAQAGSDMDSNHGGDIKSERSMKVEAHKLSGKKVHWSYKGFSGPKNWSELSEDYALCGEGENQSPINISATAERQLDSIMFHYNPSPVRAINNGHTVQVNYAPGSYMEVGGRKYNLLQFHFHTPSEHVINGSQAEMELHFVHKSNDGHTAVVAVMLEAGKANRNLGALWGILPETVDQETYADGRMMNAADLLPDTHGYYHYRGSLTTPPCSEGINWFVMQDVVTLSQRAIAKFHSVVGENARPVQQLHARIPMRVSQ